MDELQQLREENVWLKRENQELRERVVAAEARIKQLVELLGQNSHNSNWPSSRDKGRPKSKSKSLRPKTKRQAGGQAGHEGHTLAFNPEPDIIEPHRPLVCSHCQTPLAEDIEPCALTKRQVIDLPPLHFITIEHQAETVMCPGCGETTTAAFPAEVTNPVQYGSQVKRLAVYLHNEQFTPYERCRQTLADLFALPISPGSLQNFVETAAEQVKPATTAIKTAVTTAEVAHADETGLSIGGKKHWLHTVSTPDLTYYEPHRSRGQKATQAIGILPHFRGTLVHDSLPLYFTFRYLIHALCNAHHLRELIAVAENDQQPWASLMIDLLLVAKQQVELARQAGQTALSTHQNEQLNQLYDAIVALGLADNPLPEANPHQRGRPKKTKSRNLLERFVKHKEAVLRFAHDVKVPFDNNLAERDIRMMKLQQKISGCFRSLEGAEQFCRLRSYISTIRKQGLSVWEALGSLFNGDVLIPQLTPV